jgi:hypothetical protein
VKLLANSKDPSIHNLQMLSSGNFDHENAYRNPLVVLKYHTGSRLGHVNLVIYPDFDASSEVGTLEEIDQ